jgi:hypothetical protein
MKKVNSYTLKLNKKPLNFLVNSIDFFNKYLIIIYFIYIPVKFFKFTLFLVDLIF